MSLFLSNEELVELTGYRRGADQVRWLKQHEYFVETNRLGRPKITLAQVNAKRLGKQSQAEGVAPQTEPNVLAFQAKLLEQRKRA